MRVEMEKSTLKGVVSAPPSKSYLIRALILSAFSNSRTELLFGGEVGEDVSAAVGAIRALGAEVIKTEKGYEVISAAQLPTSAKLFVGESATLLRLITPLLGALGIAAEIEATGSLRERPISGLTDILEKHGLKFRSKGFPLCFSGRLEAGGYHIEDYGTSGVVSGLLTALPLLDKSSGITVDLDKINKGYVDITLDILSAFGVETRRIEKGFRTASRAVFGRGNYEIEGDWSSSVVWLAAGAMCGGIAVKGLNARSLQPDRRALDILIRAGAETELADGFVKVEKGALKAVDFDGGNMLDAIPVLAVVLAAADGVSRITNLKNLKIKESDRLKKTAELLSFLSIKCDVSDDSLTIYGGALKPKRKSYTPPCDHRIIEAAAIAAAYCGFNVKNAEYTAKSYPSFFGDLKALGGNLL